MGGQIQMATQNLSNQASKYYEGFLKTKIYMLIGKEDPNTHKAMMCILHRHFAPQLSMPEKFKKQYLIHLG